MRRPKKDWQNEFKILNKMFSSLISDNESNLRELDEVKEQYNKLKQVWNSQEEQMLNRISFLESLVDTKDHEISGFTTVIHLLGNDLKNRIRNANVSYIRSYGSTQMVEATNAKQK